MRVRVGRIMFFVNEDGAFTSIVKVQRVDGTLARVQEIVPMTINGFRAAPAISLWTGEPSPYTARATFWVRSRALRPIGEP